MSGRDHGQRDPREEEERVEDGHDQPRREVRPLPHPPGQLRVDEEPHRARHEGEEGPRPVDRLHQRRVLGIRVGRGHAGAVFRVVGSGGGGSGLLGECLRLRS